jgi:hypothetical protein
MTNALSVGHYERWPQCPDLLRKSWKRVIELPYIPLLSSYSSSEANIAVHLSNSLAFKTYKYNYIHAQIRDNFFHFAGKLVLYAPETVCSIRSAVANIRQSCISDLHIHNVSLAKYNRSIDSRLNNAVLRSKFCIITKSDSYSTSSFYTGVYLSIYLSIYQQSNLFLLHLSIYLLSPSLCIY